MKPINFTQSTKVLQRPSTMAESECQSLPVWNDGKQCVSCWRPTFNERLRILFVGKVWLGVHSGKTQPPVFVSGKSIFVKTPIKAYISAFLSENKESIIQVWERVKEATKQPDKRKHFFVGVAIGLFVGILLGFFTSNWLAFLGCFIVGVIAGAIKEWYDSKGHGTVELMDFLFTVLGSLSGATLSVVVNFIV